MNHSAWDCRIEQPTSAPRQARGLLRNIPPEGNGALRLGLRFMRGAGEGLRERCDALARRAPFPSLTSWVAAARLPRGVLETFAAAGAFASFGLERREALWEVGRLASSFEQGPLFEGVEPSLERLLPELMEPCARETTVLDYRLTGVPTRAHPVALLREELTARGALSASDLRDLSASDLRDPSARSQTLSGGLVICRQRPSAANGVTFLTLEDETGFVNVIVSQALYQRYRQLIRSATLLLVRGRLERSGPVLNLVARALEDLPFPVPGLATASRDFH